MAKHPAHAFDWWWKPVTAESAVFDTATVNGGGDVRGQRNFISHD